MRDSYNRNKSRVTFKKPKGGEITLPVAVGSQDPVTASYLEVKVYNNQFDRAIRAFRALVQKERILSSYKERQSYEKPSDKKRRKRNEMKRKLLELEMKNSDFKNKKTSSNDDRE